MRCRSGDICQLDALPGERFCAAHLAVLHRVRAELADNGHSAKAVRRPRACATEGCENPRPARGELCADCQAAVALEQAA